MSSNLPYHLQHGSFSIKQMSLQASLKAVPAVREKFIDYLEAQELPAEAISGWKLVFTELVNNAVTHGANNDAECIISIEWSYRNGAVVLAVQDPGTGPTEKNDGYSTLPSDNIQEHGRGRFLVQSFVDDFIEWRGTAGYRVEVHKDSLVSGWIEAPSEEMQAILSELSASYEGLAAFYQLSDSLVKSRSLSSFLEQSIKNVQESTDLDYMRIIPIPDLPQYLKEQLHQVSQLENDDLMSPAMLEILQRKCEIVWENDTQRIAIEADVSPLNQYSSGCMLPITSEEHFFGLLVAGRKSKNHRIVSSQVNNLRTFADIFGISIANFISTTIRQVAERDLREYEIAAEIQHHLLPVRQPASLLKCDLQIFQRVAQNVAGDYAEYCQDCLGYHYLTIIDVMGKGVSAALLGIIYRTAFNLLIDTNNPLPVMLQRIGQMLNYMLGDLTMFITVTILRWHDETEVIEHVNAGHCPTVKLSTTGEITIYEPSGPPIGLLSAFRYETDVIEMEPGDRIIMVSDGCYEWRIQGELFGWNRLVDLIHQRKRQDGDLLWQDLCEVMDQNSSGGELSDDITLVFLRQVHE